MSFLEKRKSSKIKKLVLLPVCLALFTLISISIIGFYLLQQRNIEKDVIQSVDAVPSMFEVTVAEDALRIHNLFEHLEHDQTLQKAWLARDRQRLLSLASPIFRKFQANNLITHLYFHEIDGINFLRVHKPEKYGDRIMRHTLINAAETCNHFYGVELGTFGTFTLRAVHPWMINGQLEGFIELGEEVTHITPILKKRLGVELVFAVDKERVTRENWEEGRRITGRPGSWDESTRVVFMDSTFKPLPAEIVRLFAEPLRAHGKAGVSVKYNEKTYKGGVTPLYDVAGNDLGDILVLRDITGQTSALRNLSGLLVALALILGLLLFGFFYFYLGAIEKSMEQHERNLVKNQEDLALSNQQLQQEIIERKRATEIAAVMEERGRLARELHDSVTQSLYSLTLFAEANKQLAAKGDLEGLGDGLVQMEQCARDVMKEFRLLIYDLRPSALEKEGLAGALRQRLDAVERRSGVKGLLVVKKNGELPAVIEEGLYQIGQEALNNALKHSGATEVSVRLTIADGHAELEVEDNGVGFVVDGVDEQGGMGLTNMRERAEKLGGVLMVTAVPDGGTLIRVELNEISEKSGLID